MADVAVRNRIHPQPKAISPSTRSEGQAVTNKGHGSALEALRTAAFVVYFLLTLICIHATQFIGVPLYFIDKDKYYAYMAFTKQQFGLLINTITQWFSPTAIRVSADESVVDEIRLAPDGRLECDFAHRAVLLANHQIYTDWLYLWWISYTNRMHGHLFIILKESLKYIPMIGPGMMFYGFIFLARNWTKDKPRFQHRLQQLKTRHKGPMSGAHDLDPMWLLIFPEGTNLSTNGRKGSAKWSEKSGIPDMQHQLLPRSTGLQFCLNELKGTVEFVYDCTIAYEGIPRGQYGQDIFSLRSIYFQGRSPKSVNMYWRKFRVADIPIEDADAFSKWLLDRWREKDAFLEGFMQTGRFPPNPPASKKETRRARGAFYDTAVMQKYTLEFLLMFAPAAGICAMGVLVGYLFL